MIGKQPPHIFAIADTAFRLMREEQKNQSVIISYVASAARCTCPFNVLADAT